MRCFRPVRAPIWGTASCVWQNRMDVLSVTEDVSAPSMDADKMASQNRASGRARIGRARDGFERVFVLGVWLAMSGAAVLYVLEFGSSIPYADDWGYVAVLSGERPVTGAWLWETHQEHRLPLSKAIMRVAFDLGGGDLRPGMLVSVVAASASALALALAARAVRGRMSYADAFFPLAILHWRHSEQFIHFFQIYYVCAVALFCAVLATLVVAPRRPGTLATLFGGTALLLLPLHGAMGVAYAPALALGIAGVGLARLRSGEPGSRWKGGVLLGAAAGACAITVVYFVGYPGTSGQHYRHVGLAGMALSVLACAGTSLGELGNRTGAAAGAVVAAGAIASAWVVWRASRARPDARLRAFGLLAAASSAWLLAAVIGIGRAGLAGGATRYCLLTTPILFCIYLPWCKYGPRALRQFVQVLLFAVMLAFSTYHMSVGVEYGKGRKEATRRFWQDVDDGIPLTGLVGRHASYWCWDEAAMADGLRTLRERGIGHFARIRLDPPMRRRTISSVPAHVGQMTLRDGAWSGEGRGSAMTFVLDEPQRVLAVRLRFSMQNQDGSDRAAFELLWPRAKPSEPWEPYEAARCSLKLRTGTAVRTQTLWIGERINRFTVRFGDSPFTVKIESIEFLLPEAATPK